MQSRRYGKRSACALSLGAGTAPVLPKDTSLQSTRFFTPVVEKDVGCSSQKPSLPRAPLNREEASCFSGACLAQRLCPSPDRPMALTTAPNVRAAAAPQIPPITSYHDAQGYVSAPPQHAHAHQHRHHEKRHRGQHHGAREPCAHPTPYRPTAPP